MVISKLSIAEKREFIANEVFTTPEAIAFLGISRARMSTLIKQKKIIPIKKFGCVSLFLKEDLEKKKIELIELRIKYRPHDYIPLA